MLETENKQPLELGYDRPSPKLLGFLAKHYNLKSYSPQTNNYVVFDEYFRGPSKQGSNNTSRK